MSRDGMGTPVPTAEAHDIELTKGGVLQTVGYLSIKGMPLTEDQLEATRQLIKQIEEPEDE